MESSGGPERGGGGVTSADAEVLSIGSSYPPPLVLPILKESLASFVRAKYIRQGKMVVDRYFNRIKQRWSIDEKFHGGVSALLHLPKLLPLSRRLNPSRASLVSAAGAAASEPAT